MTFAAGAGIIIEDIDKIVGPWTNYSSSLGTGWSSTGTAPSLGNGTATARYLYAGNLVIYTGTLVFGSTTTFGTGLYLFPLPVNAQSSTLHAGPTYLVDQGTDANRQAAAVRLNTTSNFVLLAGTGGTVGPTTPFTFANTDRICFSLAYEGA